MRISDWSSDVCSSDLECVCLLVLHLAAGAALAHERRRRLSTQPARAVGLPDAELPGLSATGLRVPARQWRAASARARHLRDSRSEEHTSELQSLMRISYAAFCLKKKTTTTQDTTITINAL